MIILYNCIIYYHGFYSRIYNYHRYSPSNISYMYWNNKSTLNIIIYVTSCEKGSLGAKLNIGVIGIELKHNLQWGMGMGSSLK